MRTATYNALQEIQHERLRQESDEGWTAEHDDAHDDGDLAKAAACYAAPLSIDWPRHDDERRGVDPRYAHTLRWPWDQDWWKPGSDRRRQLVKAGALIVAELERLERAQQEQP